jgi:hypothetical protein
MAHTYMVFQFPDEEKAQQARHKLEGWKQAFRLDKKLQVKFDRGDDAAAGTAEAQPAHEEKQSAKTKSAAKGSKSSKSKKADKSAAADSGPVTLLVRLYFSGHEKLSEQQWLDRIPADELFQVAHPHVVREKDAAFDQTLKQFDSLE